MLRSLEQLQSAIIVLYAASLPLSITLSWIMLTAGLVVFSLLVISDMAHGRRGARLTLAFAQAPLARPVAAFALAVAISGWLNGGLPEAFASVLSLKVLIVYFWAYQAMSGNRQLAARAAQTVLMVSALAGLWGMVQQLTHFHPFGYPYLQGTGFLGGPMAFAGQMQIFSLLALALYLSGAYDRFGKFRSKLAWAFIVLCNFLGVFFASERSAWLGYIAGLLTASALWSRRMVALSMLFLMMAAILSWTTVPMVQQRLAPLADWRNEISVKVRIFLWRESLTMWQSQPIFGLGIRRFPHFNIPEAIVPGRSVDINHAHSNYLQILTTTGLVGLMTFLWMWLAALQTALRTYRFCPDRFERGIALGTIAATVALMVAGLFEYNFGTSQVRLAQWFVLAMLIRYKPFSYNQPVKRADQEAGFAANDSSSLEQSANKL